jgi:hypothetical protein
MAEFAMERAFQGQFQRIKLCFSLTVYCLPRQFTAPFLRASIIAEAKPR